MSENQPQDMEDRAEHAADELAEDRGDEPEATAPDKKAQEIADDVRAETGEAYQGEGPVGDVS